MKIFQRILFLQLLLLTVFITATAAANSGTSVKIPDNSENLPLLDGTFIQLLEKNGNWNRDQWEKQFETFHDIGLRQVVIQWTLYDNRAFYATRTFDQVSQPPLEIILERADALGMKVYLGLAADSRYWEMIKQSPEQQGEYLKRLRWKSERVAQEVAVIAAKYNSFKGWYIPEEIDDLTWRSPTSRKLFYEHIKQLSTFLTKLTPDGMVLQSAFSNARMNPDSYQEFWNDYFKETSVNMLLFQDSAGTGKLPGELLRRYLQAVRNAADTNGRKFQVVVELFTMVSEAPFKTVPAPMSRLTQQLRIADDFATGGINSFSVPDYMSADGGAAATELLNNYRTYKGGGQLTTP
jgi:hypothetical protein